MLWNILTFILTLLLLVARTFSKDKNAYDESGKEFPYRKYLLEYWDDYAVWIIGAFLGALLSSELAVPVIHKYLDWPELAEASIDKFSIALMTFVGYRLFKYLKP